MEPPRSVAALRDRLNDLPVADRKAVVKALQDAAGTQAKQADIAREYFDLSGPSLSNWQSPKNHNSYPLSVHAVEHFSRRAKPGSSLPPVVRKLVFSEEIGDEEDSDDGPEYKEEEEEEDDEEDDDAEDSEDESLNKAMSMLKIERVRPRISKQILEYVREQVTKKRLTLQEIATWSNCNVKRIEQYLTSSKVPGKFITWAKEWVSREAQFQRTSFVYNQSNCSPR